MNIEKWKFKFQKKKMKFQRLHPLASMRKFNKKMSQSREQTTQIESKEKTWTLTFRASFHFFFQSTWCYNWYQWYDENYQFFLLFFSFLSLKYSSVEFMKFDQLLFNQFNCSVVLTLFLSEVRYAMCANTAAYPAAHLTRNIWIRIFWSETKLKNGELGGYWWGKRSK